MVWDGGFNSFPPLILPLLGGPMKSLRNLEEGVRKFEPGSEVRILGDRKGGAQPRLKTPPQAAENSGPPPRKALPAPSSLGARQDLAAQPHIHQGPPLTSHHGQRDVPATATTTSKPAR